MPNMYLDTKQQLFLTESIADQLADVPESQIKELLFAIITKTYQHRLRLAELEAKMDIAGAVDSIVREGKLMDDIQDPSGSDC